MWMSSGPKALGDAGRFKWVGPPVGLHNEDVFTKLLGVSPETLGILEAKGVIGKWADSKGPKPPDDWKGQGTIL